MSKNCLLRTGKRIIVALGFHKEMDLSLICLTKHEFAGNESTDSPQFTITTVRKISVAK